MSAQPAAARPRLRADLRVALRLAARDLRGGLRGFRVMLACVALGVMAIAAIGTLRESIATGLMREGAVLLGGDAEIALSYRFASAEERAWMDEVADRVSEVVDFRSLAVAGTGDAARRALTRVKAVDTAYPLLGAVALDPPMPLDRALAAGDDGRPGAVMERPLADRLGLAPGDGVRLGEARFRLSAVLAAEPDSGATGFGLGPRTIVRRAALQGSGLLAPGSLFTARYRLDLPANTDLAALKARAGARFANGGLEWLDRRNGAPGIAEFVARMGRFLVLVGLAGLAVGGVGIAAALRAWLSARLRSIAILRSLGASGRVIFLTCAMQVAAMAALGLSLGLVLGAGLPNLLAPLIAARLPVPAAFGLYPAPLAEAALYSLLTVALFTLWPLARIERIRAATLYRKGADVAGLPRLPWLVASAALLGLLLASAVTLSGSPRLALWTAAGMLGALALLALAARGVQAAARAWRRRLRGWPALGWALAAIGAPGGGTAAAMLALGLGLSVLAGVGQIGGNLRAAIARDLPQRAPSYFFIDIQPDQLPGFLARLEGDPRVGRVDTAPILRGIITAINGRPAAQVAGDHWVLEGDRGITYSDRPPARTRVTVGAWWPAGYDGPPQLSFAAEEAAEMGLGLGDRLTVNILGRDITARITSLREVDFSTGGIGFIMAMNPAALRDAPHSYIATVHAEEPAEAEILRDISERFPNITAIRLRDAIAHIEGLLAGLARAVAWGASVTLLTGFVVLIGTAAADQHARIREAAILKVLGAGRRRILAGLALRAGLTGAAAGLVALAAGIADGWAVCRFVLETGFTVIWPSALAIVAGGITVTLATGLIFALGPLAARPAQVLRAPE